MPGGNAAFPARTTSQGQAPNSELFSGFGGYFLHKAGEIQPSFLPPLMQTSSLKNEELIGKNFSGRIFW